MKLPVGRMSCSLLTVVVYRDWPSTGNVRNASFSSGTSLRPHAVTCRRTFAEEQFLRAGLEGRPRRVRTGFSGCSVERPIQKTSRVCAAFGTIRFQPSSTDPNCPRKNILMPKQKSSRASVSALRPAAAAESLVSRDQSRVLQRTSRFRDHDPDDARGCLGVSTRYEPGASAADEDSGRMIS
jgi:hypothetical protein